MDFRRILDAVRELFRSIFKAIKEGVGLLKDMKEIRRVGKKIKTIRCVYIVDDFSEDFRGRLSQDTSEIVVDALARSWRRGKIYNWTTQPTAYLHDDYPRSLDLSIFKIRKEDRDEYVDDPDKFYQVVDRNFTIDAYQIGSVKLLENLRETPRKTLILLCALCHALGWILCFFTIFYFLLG